MSRAMIKNDVALGPKAPGQKGKSNKEGNDARSYRFFDFPPEVRRMIYKYLFAKASIRIGKRGVLTRYSRNINPEILATCRAIHREGEIALFSCAMQTFSDTTHNGRVIDEGTHLRPRHPKLVPVMHIHNFEPLNNVRLDMAGLYAYSKLRELELGLFSRMFFSQAPNHLLEISEDGEPIQDEDDDFVINQDNAGYIVTEIKKFVVDRKQYNKLALKPVKIRGLKAIVNSRKRKFRVLLRCRVQLKSIHADDVIPDDYAGVNVLMDWDAGELKQMDLNV